MIHELKTLPEYYQLVVKGIKNFEIRKNDRNFQVGDILHLEEWDDNKHTYTGQATRVKIKYILSGEKFDGLSIDYIAMGLTTDFTATDQIF